MKEEFKIIKMKEVIGINQNDMNGFTPVDRWANGYTAEEADKFRKDYDVDRFTSGNDTGTFAYSHLSEVMLTSLVARAGVVSDLEEDSMKEEIFNVEAQTQLGKHPLREIMKDDKARFQAIAVAHKGKLVCEDYRGMRKDYKHIWSSCAKTISGLIVHILEEEGKLDCNQPVTEYIKELAPYPIWQKVKVAHVLHHCSGMDFVENSENLANPEHIIHKAFHAGLASRETPPGDTIKKLLKEVPPLREQPGVAFDYSILNTQMLGMIIEQVTKKTFTDVFSERIWSLSGVESDGVMGMTPNFEVLNGGVFASKLRDFMRYGMLFTPSWSVVTKERIVSESYFENVKSRKHHDIDLEGIFLEGDMGERMVEDFKGYPPSPTHASYQWDAVFPDGDLYKAGFGGQCLYVSPSTDTVVVWFSSTYKNGIWIPAYARAIVQQLFSGKHK